MKLLHLPVFSGEKIVHVVVETPAGSRNKYAYDPDTELFMLKKTLPAGHAFPYDFGFIPNTRGGDGDPLDVLILHDEPSFTGCVIPCRLLGVVEAEQQEKKETKRNDRIFAVPETSVLFENTRNLKQVDKNLLKDILHFFISYNRQEGKVFRPLKLRGPSAALDLVRSSQYADMA